MTLIEYQKALIGIGSSTLGLYLLYVFYGLFWKKRVQSRIIWGLFNVFFVTMWFFAALLSSVPLNILCGFILYECAAWFYENRPWERLILPVIMLLGANGIQNGIGFLLADYFGENFKYLLETNILFYFCGVTISNLVLYLIVKGLQIFKGKPALGFTITGIFPILLFPITTIIAGLIIMQASVIIKDKNLEFIVSVFFLMLVVSYFYFIYVLEKQAKQERMKQQLLFMENIGKMQVAHYQELYNGQQEVRKIRHDLKNTLLALFGMIRSGDTQKALTKIQEVCGELDSASVFVQTKIPALDAVLSAKLAKAAKDNIQLSYQVSIPCLHIDQVDFSILIANALDNAIEACQRMEPSSKNRFVDLKIGTSGLYLICKIKNTSPSNGQTLRTWKEDKENHGLGLESMEKIVKNYDGSMTLEGENGMFFTSIMLKNN